MDIEEEAKKIGASGTMRYAVLFIGLIMLLFSQTILTWKSSSERDASGSVDSIQLKIQSLQLEGSEAMEADAKKSIREEIKDLTENDLADARIEAASEKVDARSNIWLTNMINMLGMVAASLGFLLIAATGSAHEKLGALVALGFIITRL